jgi:NADH:ubiquinone oxidoreductase subunit K
MIPVAAFVALSAALFTVGLYGLLTTRNAIKILMFIEILLNSAHINFVAFSGYYGNDDGIVFTMFGIALAAAEAAVAIGIFLNLYRRKGSVDVTTVQGLKG